LRAFATLSILPLPAAPCDPGVVSLTLDPLVSRTRARACAGAARPSSTRARRGAALFSVAFALIGGAAAAADLNDYPTVARADFVFACMKANGETRQALEHCSCAIDVIASVLTYERYVAAEAVLSLSQVPGPFGSMFRSPEQSRAAVADLRRAQAEAEVRCF
jgi:hypothetical protein